MLAHLYVRDFAIVNTLELALTDGLTVLTGETGAGKSILIDALALALGTRADAGAIRPGAERAEVSASFQVKPKSGARRWLQEHELAADDECVLRRVLEVDKPSKGFINGRPVPVQMLRALGELLVDIHGQHEHQSLLQRDAQRQVLDDYAGLDDTLAALAADYGELRELQTRFDSLTEGAAQAGARAELLRHQVQELDALGLKAEDIAGIETEHARLAHGAQLLEAAQSAVQVLYDDDETSIASGLARVASKLASLSEVDAKLGDIATLLTEAGIQVDDAAARLHQYLDHLDLDPQRLAWLEARIGVMHDLARKHKVHAHELPAVLERLRGELGEVEDVDGGLARLRENIDALRTKYLQIAADVSRKRKPAAAKLAREVGARMHELGMPGGQFEVLLTPLPEGEFGAHGLERVDFLVSANPGHPVKPLAKVASGGELSRISLALQVVLAGLGRIPTLIFDEVDVGVGGRVAEIVGQRLRAIGQAHQVLCITHLAQVAALGQTHLHAAKHHRGEQTLLEVRALADADRVQEIARMIGGIEINKKTLAHAEDMLSRAAV